jgi:tetratricopeptide (TPR) repeat protein
MRILRTSVLILAAALAGPAWADAELTREQALTAIDHPEATMRLAGVARLVELGGLADTDQLLSKLADDDSLVRIAADAALWQIWRRSGDADIDKLLARGMQQMKDAELDEALATFDEVVRLMPDFAEGWHQRAQVHFLLEQHEKSLSDCTEVLKRNRNHFGALSGAGQIYLMRGNAKRALEFFRRAVKVNPNLLGPVRLIQMLEEYQRTQYEKMI